MAEDLEGRVPEEVQSQIYWASMRKEAYSLKSALDDYYAFKCPQGEENRDLRNRMQRLSEYLSLCLGKGKFQTRKIDELKRSDANALRDYLLKLMSPNSVVRNIGVVKAAVNYAIKEHDLVIRNVFEGLIIQGAGAGKSDRLPMGDEDLLALEAQCKEIEPASTILTVLADTGAWLGEVMGLASRALRKGQPSHNMMVGCHARRQKTWQHKRRAISRPKCIGRGWPTMRSGGVSSDICP